MDYITFADALTPALPTDEIVFSVDSLMAALHKIPDKRHARGKLYPLAPFLTIAVLAKLMGQNQITAIAEWCKWRADPIVALFGLQRPTMPHLATWTRLFGDAVDLAECEKVIGRFFAAQMNAEVPPRGEIVVAIDGKTLRGTIPQGQTRGVHLMAAFVPQHGVVLGQVDVDGKENEIVAAPRLVAQLDLRGMVIVGDAMQAQRDLSRRVVAGQGDYLWLIKENQPSLLTDIEILFEPEPLAAVASASPTDFSAAESFDIGHGRIETRTITVSSALADYTPWPHLAQVFKVEKSVRAKRTPHAEPVIEVRYGITSLPASVASPARLLAIVRAEWGIETRLHYRRDVTLGEDASRLRRGRAPQLNALLNNVVVGLCLLAGYTNLPAARRELEARPTKALFFLTRRPLSNL